MILSGPEIIRQLELGSIEIDPFNRKQVNPGSVDLTLGNEVAVYTRFISEPVTTGGPYDGRDLQCQRFNQLEVSPTQLDLFKKNPNKDYGYDTKTSLEVRRYKIDPELGWILNPGVGYLMHTAERVCSSKFVPVLDGKSSIGRLFVKVHETAGYGDVHFNGQYTLEVTSLYPVRVYAGMRFCQIRFHVVQGEIEPYAGNYTGSDAQGPVGSKVWKQFE